MFMSSDTTSFSSINTNQIYSVIEETGFVNFIHRQDEAVYSKDSIPGDNIKIDTNIIFQTKIENPQSFCRSLANVNSFKQNKIEVKSNVFYNTDWITYFLIFCFVFYAFLQKTFLKKQRIIFNSFFNYRYTNQLIREGNIYNESGFYFLLLLSFFSFALLFLNWGVYYFYGNFLIINSLSIFLKVLAIFLLYYFGRIVLLLFISHVFKLNKLYSEFVLTQHVFFISFGIVALFFSVLVFFTATKFIIISSIIVFISFFTNYIIRLYMLTLNSAFFSLLYFFMYICTVEIMPLLVVYKLLNKI